MYSLNGQRIKNDKLTFMSYDDIEDFDNVNNKEYREEQKRQQMNKMLRAARKQIVRYQGSDRIETAVIISKRNFSSANNVIVTNGWKPSDAIAATALAKNLNAPILYVNESNIPSSTKNEIERLGAKNIYVIGGVNSVSDDVKNQLYNSISAVQTTKRISGDDRAGTALEIAKETSKYGKGKKAFVVTGTSESDCLAISAASGENNYSMFYVVNGNLDYASRSYIQNNFSGVVVANGNSNVGATVVNQLKNAGLNVSQINGYDSFDLSMKLSKNTGFYTTLHSVYLTSGNSVPDGVPGSVLAAKSGMPLMLVNGSNNKDDIVNYINNKDVDAVYILGGTNGVPTDLENAINGGGSTPNISEARNKIVQLAKAQLGKPYVWGAVGPNSFDCSGFTQYVYRNAAKYNLSRTTKTQIVEGKVVSESNAKPGDLVFFGNPVHHVGIYIGNGKMIHAAGTEKNPECVKIGEIHTSYLRFNCIRNLLD
ncbi:cell wall-binding repeat-containing protein [Peptostreptococcus sp. D1]|uniref:cell wall-binding repeat-containing protein n=1 Tax=Peptostreptococcus sp. D1 TaxID=72304 RepID=UPI0008E72449|nr:cell wall-binding repeat-containing protein [Peptostreptococcus sp. D1]SFE68658.1 Cell wall-associated hydrolase, NlpC family [Peptostreptococcus sp. D1]